MTAPEPKRQAVAPPSIPGLESIPGLVRATVCGASEGGAVLVQLRQGARVDASVAVLGYVAREGDAVLLGRDDEDTVWITAVVPAASPTPLLDQVLTDAEAEPQRVYDKRGELLFEYRPGEDRASVFVPSGDLTLELPGTLRVQAGEGIELDGAEVKVRARRGVSLQAGSDVDAAGVHVEPARVSLVARTLSAAADRTELIARAVSAQADDLETHATRIRTTAKVIETRAGRLVERARDSYREVMGLAQTRAGKLRMVAKTTVQLVGENTLLKARDRMKVRGEKIFLA